MVQQIPHKPQFLSDGEWIFILQRDCNQCALYDQCRRAGQIGFCSNDLDVDHIQPLELGGDNSFANLRLLCQSNNRGRGLVPEQKWLEKNFWDSEFSPRALRNIQRIAGYQAVLNLLHAIKGYEAAGTENFRRSLLGSITLLPGATGTGKALLAQSVLFAFNQIVGLGRPRCLNVLWFTQDTELRDAGQTEIEEEAYELGLVGKKPIVHVAESFADLLRGPMGAPVTVSAPHSLWKIEGDKTRVHSDYDKRRVLSLFDVLVFDECDWANEQLRHISLLATNCLQFALTASPPLTGIADKKAATRFLSRFVLIDPDAIADFHRAVELDACLKVFPPATDPAVVVAADHSGYDFLKAGFANESQSKMPPNHALYIGAIIAAVIDADQRETRMKQASPDLYYSPHLMPRLETISGIKDAMLPQLNLALEKLYQMRVIVNPGWGASAIYSGYQRDMPPDERSLSAKTKRGKWRHPFMRAKDNNGVATSDCKRVLLICQMCLRGINNWMVDSVVDCTSAMSVIELIQFNIGRPRRWPPNRAAWLEDEKLRGFAQSAIYIPVTDFLDKKMEAIMAGVEFVQHMREHIGQAGFLTWQDIIDGASIDPDSAIIDPVGPPLTKAQKYQIQGTLATFIAGGKVPTVDTVEPMIEWLFPTFSPKQKEKASNYTKSLFKPDIRDMETTAIKMSKEYELHPSDVMVRLKPQNAPTLEQLLRFVKAHSMYNEVWEAYEKELKAGSVALTHAVSEQLRQLQTAAYREPIRVHSLHGTKSDPGVITEVANELAADLYTAGQATPQQHAGKIRKAVIGACKKIFGISDASEGKEMDQPAYHIAIKGDFRDKIQRIARGILIQDGDLGDMIHLGKL